MMQTNTKRSLLNFDDWANSFAITSFDVGEMLPAILCDVDTGMVDTDSFALHIDQLTN
jgi:hypothetical protein